VIVIRRIDFRPRIPEVRDVPVSSLTEAILAIRRLRERRAAGHPVVHGIVVLPEAP
jgi:hypothetical protein